MANSPEKGSSEFLALEVTSAGKVIKDDINIISVEVTSSLNAIPTARLVIADGNMPEKKFPVSDQNTFKPGAEITISAGYASKTTPIFSGVVIKQSVIISEDNFSRLVIECRDKAIAMTVARKNDNYIKQKDSDIISTVVKEYSGLSADVTTTQTQYPELVKYNCTDWDFIITRAQLNGLLVSIDKGKLTVAPPKVDGDAELVVSWGTDLIEFNADLDARYQFKSVIASSWDIKTQKMVAQQVPPQTLNKQGNITSAELAKVLGLANYGLQTSSSLETPELKQWAKSRQVQSGLARIRGGMKFQGNAKAKVGTLIEVQGVGQRFNGSVFVSTVIHRLEGGQWITEVVFGLSPHFFSEMHDLKAPPASGILPAIEGLQIGTVLKLEGDPEKQERIQVSVPVIQAKTKGVWARLANYYASSGVGNFFIPEVGDEVILGYINNDPNNPIILGSLYSSSKKPPYDIKAKNPVKGIVSKSKLKIEFDDENKVMTIITPGNNQLVLSDKEKSVVIEDQNNNKITLSSDGISLNSSKNIELSAKNAVNISATGKLSISTKDDLTLSGTNINQTANMNFVAKGNASLALSASGEATLKGAMVMIN
ncbi:type VI secretion system tip protein VgrG [Zooshikella sp. RANM57]|uniref:type VI secretion system tip protein VgrG n=1 Tax=Zooshikella sp. RANM57 TaxID=3425863 RepID=UPI003D6F5D33